MIEIGSSVEYDKNRRYFQFKYEGSIQALLCISFGDAFEQDLFLIYPSGEKVNVIYDYQYRTRKGHFGEILKENGTYYLEVECFSYLCEIGGSFSTIIIGDYIKTIDLSQKTYFNDYNYYFGQKYYGLVEYKVSGLKEDKFVYFTSLEEDRDYPSNYYPYYPEETSDQTDNNDKRDGKDGSDESEPTPKQNPSWNYYQNLTVFEVFNIQTGRTEKSVRIYKFVKDYEYIIRIHSIIKDNNYDEKQYEFFPYLFFPITLENYKAISSDNEFFNFNGPMLGVIKPNSAKNIMLFTNMFDEFDFFLTAKTNESIDDNYNLESLSKISKLEFEKKESVQINASESHTTVVFIIPREHESNTKLYIVNDIIEEYKDSYTIPGDKSTLIFCEDKEGKAFEYHNNITTFTSNNKNMHFIISEENEGTDYLIYNYMNFPIFVGKSTQETKITTKNYPPRFTFFGVENPYLFKAFYNTLYKTYKYSHININNYLNLTQMNFRINSKYLPWFEFYNFYFNQLDLKINFYINQIYGGSDI